MKFFVCTKYVLLAPPKKINKYIYIYIYTYVTVFAKKYISIFPKKDCICKYTSVCAQNTTELTPNMAIYAWIQLYLYKNKALFALYTNGFASNAIEFTPNMNVFWKNRNRVCSITTLFAPHRTELAKDKYCTWTIYKFICPYGLYLLKWNWFWIKYAGIILTYGCICQYIWFDFSKTPVSSLFLLKT